MDERIGIEPIHCTGQFQLNLPQAQLCRMHVKSGVLTSTQTNLIGNKSAPLENVPCRL